MQKQETKKQVRQTAVIMLVIGLVLSLAALGFAYWDHREQAKFYNIWERGSGLDFKTGKPIPNYQPPPFEYRFDRSALLPFIGIFGAVSLLCFLIAALAFRKSLKMIETPEMRVRDAEIEAISNSPEVKNIFRQELILRLLPIVLLIPVPFIAVYGLGAVVFAVYMLFVAVAVGASYFLVPRLMSKK